MRPSPRRGGGNLCARNWRPSRGVVIGVRQPVRDAGGPVPPGAGEASPAPGGTGAGEASPAPGGTGASPAPGGTGPTQFRLCERTYPPEGGERRSPIYIRGSYARTRRNFVRNFFDKGIVASTSVPHGLSCTTLYKTNRVVQATREGRWIRQFRAPPSRV